MSLTVYSLYIRLHEPCDDGNEMTMNNRSVTTRLSLVFVHRIFVHNQAVICFAVAFKGVVVFHMYVFFSFFLFEIYIKRD